MTSTQSIQRIKTVSTVMEMLQVESISLQTLLIRCRQWLVFIEYSHKLRNAESRMPH